MKIGSLEVRWTSPVSHYVVPVAFWAASRNIKQLSSSPGVRVAGDALLLTVGILKLKDIAMGLYVARHSKEELLTTLKGKTSSIEYGQSCVIELLSLAVLIDPRTLLKSKAWPLVVKATLISFLVGTVFMYISGAAESSIVKKILPNSSWAQALRRHERLAERLNRSDSFLEQTTFSEYGICFPNWLGLDAKLAMK